MHAGLLNMTEHILTTALPHVYKVEEPGSINSRAIPIVPAEHLSPGPLTSATPVNPADPVNPAYPAEQQLNPFLEEQHQQPYQDALTHSGRQGPRIKLQDLTVISKQSVRQPLTNCHLRCYRKVTCMYLLQYAGTVYVHIRTCLTMKARGCRVMDGLLLRPCMVHLSNCNFAWLRMSAALCSDSLCSHSSCLLL